MTQTFRIDEFTRQLLRDALTSPALHIASGLGGSQNPGTGEACTIAEIMLVLTGDLSDGPHPCISERSEEHTSELQSHSDLVCRLLLEKKKLRSLASQ